MQVIDFNALIRLHEKLLELESYSAPLPVRVKVSVALWNRICRDNGLRGKPTITSLLGLPAVVDEDLGPGERWKLEYAKR